MLKIEAGKYYCYLQGETLYALLSEESVLDDLLRELHVKAHGKRSYLVSVNDKVEAVVEAVTQLGTAKARGFYGVTPEEILAVHIWRAWKDSRRGNKHFHAAKEEADLKSPVAAWLVSRGYAIGTEFPMGVSVADVVGLRERTGVGAKISLFFKPELSRFVEIAAVELKNKYSQWGKAEKQMSDYGDYAKFVYFGCTPAFAADFLDRMSKATTSWNPDALNDKLRDHGYGLLLVRGDEVDEVIEARPGQPRRTDEFMKTLDMLAARESRKPKR